jgi:hypothetical protein
MVKAEFTDEEARIIEEILKDYLANLRGTFYVTDTIPFQNTEELVHKKAVVKDIIERVEDKAA